MPIDLSEIAKHETVLDVNEENLARTYAVAVLDAAAGQGVEAEVVEDLVAIVHEVLDRFPDFGEAIRSAFLSHDERLGLLDRVLGGRVQTTTLNFLKVLSAHGRTAILRSVVHQTELLHETRSNRVRVEVTSADPLPNDLVEELRNVARTKLGAEPILKLRVDESLVAGLEIRIGDTVYDGSLRTVFARARESMVEQTVSRIETNPHDFISNN